MLTLKGTFQVPVVRFFDKETYATQFTQEGRARFRNLESFHDPHAAVLDCGARPSY